MKKIVGIGIDLGGTTIKYALGDSTGTIIKQGQLSTNANAHNNVILDQIAKAVRELITFAGGNGLKPAVIGIGTPGCVDIRQGFLKGSTPNFRHWKQVAIGEEISNRVHIPVFVDNDANLMALGEAKYGAGIGHANIICLTIGTGIGGGIIINGDLYRGSNYAGAELGHMSIKYDGIKCRCGGRGCLEKYSSATAMIEFYRKSTAKLGLPRRQEQLTVKEMFREARDGNAAAIETIDKATYFLGRGIASLMNIFNPTCIIIGGGVAEAGRQYLDKVEATAFKYAMQPSVEQTKIVKAKLGNSAGYMGALAFAFNQLK
jgi:glucokinase